MAKNYILRASDIQALEEQSVVHQFNKRAIRNTRSLGDLTGLSAIGVHLVRVASGDETTQHHNHEFSDEFIYVIEGNCTLKLDSDQHALQPGDFVGFPANGPAHSMKNTGSTDLVYLMGGSRPDLDICNYPDIKRRMYLVRGKREFVDLEHLHHVER